MTQPLAPSMITKLKKYFSGLNTPAYLVGGYLRDSLLSLPPQRDVDIALSADSQSVGRDLASAVGGSFVPLSPERGIARVVAEDSGAGPWKVDLVTLPGSIEEDLARRDFTIDALALPLCAWDSPVPGELVIDPFNGRHDLLNKCVRAVSPHVFPKMIQAGCCVRYGWRPLYGSAWSRKRRGRWWQMHPTSAGLPWSGCGTSSWPSLLWTAPREASRFWTGLTCYAGSCRSWRRPKEWSNPKCIIGMSGDT